MIVVQDLQTAVLYNIYYCVMGCLAMAERDEGRLLKTGDLTAYY